MKMTFESWCAKNYYKLRERLSLQGLFDEDAYQDAYLSILSRVRKGEQILCYDKHITNAYQAYRKKHISEGFVYVRPDELLFTLLPDNAPLPFEPVKEKPNFAWLIYDIKQFVRRNNPTMDVIVWEAKNIHRQSITDISGFTGLKYREIREINNNINTRICNRFANAYKKKMSV